MLFPIVQECLILGKDAEYTTDKVVEALRENSPTLKIRDQILKECDDKPYCWVCNYRIYLDEPENSDAEFSLDHVIRNTDGGQRTVENLKPAHRLCNSMRHASKHRSRTLKRVKLMFAHLTKKGLKRASEGPVCIKTA